MFQNYLNIVLRGILRHKTFSAINILGLAIGITCCLLILLFVQYEFSYDRHHEKLDRIHRVSLHAVLAGNEINSATTPYPMAAALPREFTEVETAARYRRFFTETLVGVDDIQYREVEVFHADPELLDILTFNFVAGDPATALTQPNTVVINETMAAKYFPETQALGQQLTFNNSDNYLITGVIEDFPENSHTHPDFLVSFTSDPNHDSTIWVSNNIRTYALMRPNVSIADFEQNLQSLIPKYVVPEVEEILGASFEDFINTGGRYAYSLQALKDIHLYSDLEGELEPPGNVNYVYTFMAVAMFILLLACINYMNLSTARSTTRSKEISVRKTLGANQNQLALQFLTESILVSLLALLIALLLVVLLLPAFNSITEKTMELGPLVGLDTLPILLLITFMVGLLSGSYPSLFLSRFNPQQVLKGNQGQGNKSARLRSSLVVFQFALSISLVSATLIVYSQLEYMRTKNLGFDKEQLIVIHRAGTLGDQTEAFKQQLQQLPNVISVASSSHVPGSSANQNVYILEGRPTTESKALWNYSAGYNYVETMGFELLAGRGFSENFGSDTDGFVINESAARELGIDLSVNDPTQFSIVQPAPQGTITGPIVGMVSDFHFESLHQEIRPMLLNFSNFVRFVVVRVEPGNIQQIISQLESTWNQITSDEPFEYSFIDEDFENLHQGDRKMGEIFTIFSVLAVLIACLGLYGLASFTIEQRTKEIGIRKTLGASLSNIVIMIASGFMTKVVIAILVAIPITYFAMNEWLQIFSYRTAISPWSFLTAGTLAITIAFVTVSFESVKAALVNPVLTLRDD